MTEFNLNLLANVSSMENLPTKPTTTTTPVTEQPPTDSNSHIMVLRNVPRVSKSNILMAKYQKKANSTKVTSGSGTLIISSYAPKRSIAAISNRNTLPSSPAISSFVALPTLSKNVQSPMAVNSKVNSSNINTLIYPNTQPNQSTALPNPNASLTTTFNLASPSVSANLQRPCTVNSSGTMISGISTQQQQPTSVIVPTNFVCAKKSVPINGAISVVKANEANVSPVNNKMPPIKPFSNSYRT